MLGRYETIVVGAPTLTEEEHAAIVTSLEGTIAEGKGTLIRTEPWGKKKLAYRIQKFEDGYYTLLFYEAEPTVVREIERKIRMNDTLIRFITVKVDWEEKVARAEAHKALRRRPESDAIRGESLGDDIPFGEGDGMDALDGGDFGGRG